ncbi:MAG: 16S rRNA (guanine966-N2)-methyltransferase [Oceanicoccus sp.]|jgi:16S rRNA (guanine966-N2)-methyltransferase
MNSRQKKTSTNALRIIGGSWRGRKLAFPSIEGLRPTPDRIRETLFNWLTTDVVGARCLDLFAGSGALGLEALSRGASHVDMVDSQPGASAQLQLHLDTLMAKDAESTAAVHCLPAKQWLAQYGSVAAKRPVFDVVFIDPPFHQDLAGDCIVDIEQLGLLAERAVIYLEMGRDEALPIIPANWRLHREKTTGQVSYRLFRRD